MFLKSILLQFKFVEVVTGFFLLLFGPNSNAQHISINQQTTKLPLMCNSVCLSLKDVFQLLPNLPSFQNFTELGQELAQPEFATSLCLEWLAMFFSRACSVPWSSQCRTRWLQLYFRIVWPPLASTLIPKEHLECGGWGWRGRPKKRYTCLGRKSKAKRKSLLFQIKNGMSSEVRHWWRCTQLMSALSELLALGPAVPFHCCFHTILVHPSLVPFFPNLWPNDNRSAPLVELQWTLQWRRQMCIKTLANVRSYLKWKLF